MLTLYIKQNTIAKNAATNATVTANVRAGAKFSVLVAGKREASHTKITIDGTIKGLNTWWFYDGHCSRADPGATAAEGTIKPGDFRVSSIARRLIADFEGTFLDAYFCPIGVPTIGTGATLGLDGKPVKIGDHITQLQAEQLLDRDCERFIAAINRLVKTRLTGSQCAALLSWTFNCGEGALEDSTLLKVINSGASHEAVIEQFKRWTNGGLPGLVARREAESKLWKGEPIDVALRTANIGRKSKQNGFTGLSIIASIGF